MEFPTAIAVVGCVVVIAVTVIVLYWSWIVKTGMNNAAKAWHNTPMLTYWLTRPAKGANWIFRHAFQRDKVRAKKKQREQDRTREDERAASMQRAMAKLFQCRGDILVVLTVCCFVGIVPGILNIVVVAAQKVAAAATFVSVMFATIGVEVLVVLGVVMFFILQLYRERFQRLTAIISTISEVPQQHGPETVAIKPLIKREDLVTVYCPVQSGVILNMLSLINRPTRSKQAYQELKRLGFDMFLQNSMQAAIERYKRQHKIKKLTKAQQQLILLHTVVTVVQNTLKGFAIALDMDEDDVSDTGAAAGTSFTVDLASVDTPEGKEELTKKLADSVMLLDQGAKKFVCDSICTIINGVRLEKGGSMFVPLQFLFNMAGDRGLFLFYALYFEGRKAQLIPASMASAWSTTHFSAGTLGNLTFAAGSSELSAERNPDSRRNTPFALDGPSLSRRGIASPL